MSMKVRIIFLCLLFSLSGFAQNTNLIINIKKVKVDQSGQIIVNIYKDEETWNNPEQAYEKQTIDTLKGSIKIIVDSLKFENYYAVQIIHDKNQNNKLDFRTFPFPRPKEGVGLSNNKFRFGPPRYEDAKVLMDSLKKTINIEMRY